jgi:hypothetical protein
MLRSSMIFLSSENREIWGLNREIVRKHKKS